MQRIPDSVASLLNDLEALLRDRKPREALELLRRFGTSSAETRNAQGVCLMRAGEFARALDLFRGLVLDQNGVSLRSDAPVLHKVNYATALLLTGNIAGCAALLKEIGQPLHPAVRRLNAAIEAWRRSLPWTERLAFRFYGSTPGTPLVLDFPPGELRDDPRDMLPAA